MVFDNHSTDGSPTMVSSEFPEVTLKASDINFGYGGAANRAFRGASAEFLILSNSDVVFRPDGIEKLCQYLHKNPEVGVAGPRLVSPEGTLERSGYNLPGGVMWLFDNDLVAPLLGIIPGIRQHLLRAWTYDSDRDVPVVKGAVLAIRRKAFEEVEGFDESFFMYYEEMDLCVRIAQKGWRIRFTPITDVVHLQEASTRKARAAMAVERYVSTMRFARIHYSPLHTAGLFLVWKAILLLRLASAYLLHLTSHNAELRTRLAEDRIAWKRALRWTFTDLHRG